MKKFLQNASILALTVLPNAAFAQLTNPATPGGLSTEGLEDTIGTILNAVLSLVGVIALAVILWGGFRWMTAAGNEDSVGEAKKILAAGGVVAMPKFALTGMAWQGYYLDTEGNTFGIHQPDPNAK